MCIGIPVSMIIPTHISQSSEVRWGNHIVPVESHYNRISLLKRVIFLLIFLPDLEVMPVFKNIFKKSVNINKK